MRLQVKDAAGKVLCDVPGFQHNKKLGRAQQKSALETILATVGEPQESDEASTAPSRGGLSVCARIGVTVFIPLQL